MEQHAAIQSLWKKVMGMLTLNGRSTSFLVYRITSNEIMVRHEKIEDVKPKLLISEVMFPGRVYIIPIKLCEFNAM